MTASRRTGYMWHERFGWHDTGRSAAIWPPNPMVQPIQAFENAETKTRMASLVEVSGLGDELTRIRPRPATDAELERVHVRDYLDRLARESAHIGGEGGDGETIFGAGSYDIARIAAGGLIECVDAVLTGEVDNAYALVRPPGHHAEQDLGRGYCLLANVPIAIEHARAVHGLERIAIVDYDVHHGNGAQRIYWDEPAVLAISLHQDRLFPVDSGDRDENGGGAGAGANLNVPLPAGTGHGGYFDAFDRVVAPALRRFAPQLIMVSSGFDPAMLDPLGAMSVTSEGFRGFAERLLALADELCDGRVVFSHEGGYSAAYVPFCGLAVIEELSGHRTGVDDPFEPGWRDNPAHALLPHQRDAVDAAAALVERVPAGPGR
ncbi:MAG: class II histone deacetylase [Microbacteriaceae bacterium]|nr:class II histone deacetylase [Microbacteriaceae bacterium]